MTGQEPNLPADDMDILHGRFLPDELPAIERLRDACVQQPFNRRQLFQLGACVAASAYATDVQIGEDLIWRSTDAVFTAIETEPPAADFQQNLTVLMPGLGIPGEQADRMAHVIAPSAGTYGHIAYARYADNGLTQNNYRQMADAFGRMFQTKGIQRVVAVCHSAGGANFNRMLQAPAHPPDDYGPHSDVPKSSQEAAWEYWRRQYGVSIDGVVYISSPPNISFVKDPVKRSIGQALGFVPEAALRFGPVAKLLGSLLINHTLDAHFYHSEMDKIVSAWRAAGDSFSPTDWMTQVKVLESMGLTAYRGILADTTQLAVIRPANAKNDTVVETSNLPAAWAIMHDRPVDTVMNLRHVDIGHGNLEERAPAFNSLLELFFKRLYPPPPAIKVGSFKGR